MTLSLVIEGKGEGVEVYSHLQSQRRERIKAVVIIVAPNGKESTINLG
jgi:hypothetical protein